MGAIMPSESSGLPEPLYTGVVPVVVRCDEHDDVRTTLTIEMAYGTTQPRHQRVLQVQLTDESNPFLLYNLDISEDDFHVLKTDQCILVDFHTFPTKLVELLCHCQAAAEEESPRFIADLSTRSGAPIFTVTETNQFRQLAHIALKFVAGNDAAIKRYLSGRVTELKSELSLTRDELCKRTCQLQQTVEHAESLGERLRTSDEDHALVIGQLEARHSGLSADAREKAAGAQQELARASEEERRRLAERHEAELDGARRAQQAAEAQLAELNEEHHEVLHQLRERENRLDSLEAEAVGLRRTSDEMREENAALTQSKHALETAASAREVELCALKQSLRDKEELNEKVGSLLDAANEAKQQQLENLGFVKEANEQLQAKLKAAGEEAVKGSELVNKLQAEAKALRAKLKQKSATMSQQEELAAQKQTEIEEAERTVSELRAQLAEESGVKEGAIESGAETKRQLVEAQELIRSNQQIIQWLNKELNDSQKTAPRLHGGALPSFSLGAPAFRSSGAFRPSLPAAAEPPPTRSLGATPLADKSNFFPQRDVSDEVIKPSPNAIHEGIYVKTGAALRNSTPALRSKAGIACMSEGAAAATLAGSTPTAPTSRFFEFMSPAQRLVEN